MLLRYTLALLLLAPSARAATIQTFASITAFHAGLAPLFFGWELDPNYVGNPGFKYDAGGVSMRTEVWYSVAGHVDTEAGTWTLDELVSLGPQPASISFDRGNRHYSWEWADLIRLVPLFAETATVWTPRMFEDVVLGTWRLETDGVETAAYQISFRPQFGVTYYPATAVTPERYGSTLAIAGAYVRDMSSAGQLEPDPGTVYLFDGDARLRLTDIQGAVVPEPLAPLLALLGLSWAAGRRARRR